jgi:thiol-disulfide isomerase/thioredoxin
MFCGGRRGNLMRLAVWVVSTAISSGIVHAQTSASPKGVVTLSGQALDPFHKASGKVIVLVFVRTDCPISNRYAPTIQEISGKYKDRAEFYLVYPVKSETTEQIKQHLKEYGYSLTVLRDPEYSLVKRAETQVTPEAAVFSADGKLLYHGRINDWYAEFGKARRAPTTQELTDAVAAAIAGKPVAVASEPAVGCFLPDKP